MRDSPELAHCDFKNGREAGMNTILEIVGGGVGCFDFDNDGQVDLMLARGGAIDQAAKRVTGITVALLHAQANWSFLNATTSAHIDTSNIHSHGVTVADYDNDGFEDVAVYGYNGVTLLHNLGDGTFLDVAHAIGLTHTAWTTTACWLDLNADQALDLFLGSYVDWKFETHEVCQSKTGQPDVCSPNVFAGQSNMVYLADGQGAFVLAPDLLPATQPSKSLGAVAAEFVPEEGVGLYVANDLIANYLFSRINGRWQENAFARGAAIDDAGVANGSMGIALLDFNLDRKSDLFVTNFEHEKMALYLNHGIDGFHYHSRQAGLNRQDLQLVGFGVVAADFDSDGDEDVLFNSGHVHYYPDVGPMEQPPAYLSNEAGRKFDKVVPQCEYFTKPTVGRGLATADLDADGDLDFVTTSLFGPPMLIENTTVHSSNWLTVQLIGKSSARLPIGAVVELTAGKHQAMRQVYGGGSYLSHSQSLVHFAWPKTAEDLDHVQLNIRWPSGISSTHQLLVGHHAVIVER